MMRKVIDDLFTNNPSYKGTPVHPSDIIQPIGYASLKHSAMAERPKTRRLELFEFPQQPLAKTAVNRQGNFNEGILEVSMKEAKGICIGGDNLKYLEDRQAAAKGQLERLEWFSEHPVYGSTKILQLLEVLAHLKDRLFCTEDYSLSHYCYFLETDSIGYGEYLYQLVNREFIEYKVSGMHLCKQQPPEQLKGNRHVPPIDITNLQQVKQLVDHITQTNKQLDPNYSGLHLFVGLAELADPSFGYQECQTKFLPILHYYVFLLSGTLADGQSAILRIYSNIRHKTNELLFLLRTMFYKVTLLKPVTSTLLSHEKYLICQGFKLAIGRKIFSHLQKNYQLMAKHSETALLVKSADIFKTDFYQYLQDYNNILVNKMLKPLFDKILSNSGAIYVPNLSQLPAKLKHLWLKHPAKELIDFMKGGYKFQGKPISQIKLSAPTALEQPTYDRHRDDRHHNHQYRPRGNSFRGNHSHDRRPFSNQRRYNNYQRR